MTDTLVREARADGATGHGQVDRAVARHAFRQVWIGACVCAVAFGGTAASSALSYVSSFSTAASRHQVAVTTSSDKGLAILLGPVSAVGTVGGYTVYKGFVFLTTIGALWAILASTRVLRGEEDSGRWQLVLAGTTRASRATVAVISALVAAVGVIFAGTTLITLAAGLNHDVGFGMGETALYGLSIAAPVLVFVSVGAVASQLCRTRRTASGLAIALFGLAFILRMIGDTGPSTHWVRWATPFGWTELMAPFTRNNLWPLVPALVTTITLSAVAVVLASRRDVGDGLLSSPDVAPLRPFGLGSALGLSARLELPVLAAWCVGATASGLALGVIAELTTAKIPGSLGDTLHKFGVHGSFATQYFGVAFLLVGTVVALLPAGQVGAACDEETSGRLVQILASPTRRTTWFAGRLLLTGAAIIAAGLLAGFGAWLGAESQGVDLHLATMVGAGLNVVPTALVALGIGALVLSFAPRAAAVSVYAVITWSLLVDLLASMVAGLTWLNHLSLFHYMALAPAQDAAPRTLVTTTVLALGLCLAATLSFGRRDVKAG